MVGLYRILMVVAAACFLVADAQIRDSEIDPSNRHELEKYTAEINQLPDAFLHSDLLAGLRVLSSADEEGDYDEPEALPVFNATQNDTVVKDTNYTESAMSAEESGDRQIETRGLLDKWKGRQSISTTTPAPEMGGLMDRIKNWGKPKTLKERMKRRMMETALEAVDDDCTRQLGKLLFAITRKEKYALRVLDAMGKPPADIFGGDVLWLGSYDECRNITAVVPEEVNEDFHGLYCRAKLTMDAKSAGGNISVIYGVCMPDVCTEDQVEYFLDQLFARAQITGVTVSDPVCPEKTKKLSNGDMGMLTVLAAIGLTVLIGTIYDAICRIIEKSIKDAAEERRKNASIQKTTETEEEEIEEQEEEEVEERLHEDMEDEIEVEEQDTEGSDIIEEIELEDDPEVDEEENDHPRVRASRGYSFNNPDQILVHNDEVEIEFARIDSRARTLTLVDEGSGCISTCKRILTESYQLDKVWEMTKGVCNDILMSFSIIRNGERLLSTPRASDDLKSLDGIRVLSCGWIVLGHSYAMILIYITNPLDFMATMKSFFFQPVMNTALAVETFFCMGGLLVTYWTLKKLYTTGLTCSMVASFFAHRIWRVMPVYLFTLMLWTNLMPHLPAGPLMDKIHSNPRMAACSKYWWTNVLLINNFLPADPMKACMGWTWYLADDMQFYILSPIFIYLFYKSWKIATMITVPIVIAGAVFTGMIARTYEIETPRIMDTLNQARAGGGQSSEEWGQLFVRPYHRIGAYLVGIMLGYILFVAKGRVRINKYLCVFLWVVILGASVVCAYGLYGHYQLGEALPLMMSTSYIALSRFIFSLCVMWIIFACQTGNGGPIHSILAWPGFRPLSRLTFLVYLIHPMVINFTYTSTHNPYHFDAVSMTYLFIGHLALSYVAAFIIHLLIEGPTISVGRMCRRYWNDRVRRQEEKVGKTRVGTVVSTAPDGPDSNC